MAFLLDEQLPGLDAVLNAVRGLDSGQTVLNPRVVDFIIRRGDTPGLEDLTPRELDVLERMAHGLSNRAIADDLHISVKSIEKGVTAIFLKLGPFDPAVVDRRVSAALVYLQAQSDPFGPIADAGLRAAPVVILEDAQAMLSAIRGGRV
jgi:DNA-binding NarL/FixJ family response regulator